MPYDDGQIAKPRVERQHRLADRHQHRGAQQRGHVKRLRRAQATREHCAGDQKDAGQQALTDKQSEPSQDVAPDTAATPA